MPRLFTILLLTLLLAGCNHATAYTIPADSVALSGCPIPGVSLPPGSVAQGNSEGCMGWCMSAEVPVGWKTLRSHMDAVMTSHGFRRMPHYRTPDADYGKAAAYGRPHDSTQLWLKYIPDQKGINCTLRVVTLVYE